MYGILVRLIIWSAFLQLGLSLSHIEKCDSRLCLAEIQNASKTVLKIDWKPISVFPAEAKRFR